MEEFKKLLKQTIKHNPEGYTSFYSQHEEEFLKISKGALGIKSDVFLPEINDLEKIRFSSVFSDLVNIYPTGIRQTGKLIIKNEQDVTVPKEILDLVIKDGESPVMQAGYLTRSDTEIKTLLKSLRPLLYQGNVVVHNTRAIFGRTNQPSGYEDGKVWQEFLVSPESEAGNWLVMNNSKHNDSLPINFSPVTYANERELFDLSVPYISNVPIDDLAKILEDNSDLLATFRNQVNELVKNAMLDGKTVHQMKQDLVRPQIEAISRSFRKIQNQHRYKLLRAVLTFAGAALVAPYTAALTAAIAVMGGIGVSTLDLITNEAEFQKEVADLKEQPLYLMWRMKNKI